ncbi:ATP-binding protein [Chromobacterium haemolyticum]|uniref:ATP-binding protein n=1 Tax=Chromobacterium haemolyticum TaxID=394935 RepID=A0ABS3GNJ4_9NEIS|nr:ATP-binding protein [Chromobacterium haemolyticum]MBK0414543.1 ATP-binding protein [Chromobacterium haemolyticum]MBO0415823.1 ATP-binding protein [Chromobacterium haemolyticum]MBO0499083.1 ATP-binding protein [Chromobacterium haemolyticum]MDH0341771.1 ATP-binding protein [Chromobacterium haemolyticum]OQS37963.1 AAA family ATPase [Chromobacterium haemolyticum]
MEQLQALLTRAEAMLTRLEPLLPPARPEPDWSALAFRWQRQGMAGWLEAVAEPHAPELERLTHIDAQRAQLLRNTRQFVKGRPANNVLLTGARGTGKSSLVKALLPEFAAKGLRLIEVDKAQLGDLNRIVELVAGRKERFILFCDDLSFEQGDDAYKALKTALDGGLARRVDNVLVYATSNRRHLMPEKMSENREGWVQDGEIHPGEAIEEKVSLSDRFGLWLSFYPFDQDAYLAAAAEWLAHFGLKLDAEAEKAALHWSHLRGSRSGRVAWQFACDWAGRSAKERKALL